MEDERWQVPPQHRSESGSFGLTGPLPPLPPNHGYSRPPTQPLPAPAPLQHQQPTPPNWRPPPGHATSFPPISPNPFMQPRLRSPRMSEDALSDGRPSPSLGPYSPAGPSQHVPLPHPAALPLLHGPASSPPRNVPLSPPRDHQHHGGRESTTPDDDEDDDSYMEQTSHPRARQHSLSMTATTGDDIESPSHSAPPPSKRPRALKQTRRAEQNRAAQRAFRERKEVYLRELEDRSKALDALQAEYDAGTARRAEVEERARALADRAVALDAQERALQLKEAQLIDSTRPNRLPPSPFAQRGATAGSSTNGMDGANGSEAEVTALREEVLALRRELSDRDTAALALRRALEEVSTDNGRLRRAWESAQEASAKASTELLAVEEPLAPPIPT